MHHTHVDRKYLPHVSACLTPFSPRMRICWDKWVYSRSQVHTVLGLRDLQHCTPIRAFVNFRTACWSTPPKTRARATPKIFPRENSTHAHVWKLAMETVIKTFTGSRSAHYLERTWTWWDYLIVLLRGLAWNNGRPKWYAWASTIAENPLL